MRKTLFLLALVVLFLVSACSFGWAYYINPDLDLKFITTYDNARLYKAGPYNILELRGGYRQMGRQYGKLLKDQLYKYYDVAVNETFIKELGLSYETLRDVSKRVFDLYPVRVKEILYGIAETSQMDLEKIIILNGVIDINEFFERQAHCSGIAVWGDYTNGGPLLFGRNFDYPAYFKKFNQFLTVVVYNPFGANPTAIVGYPAQIEIVHGMNNQGLFLEINDGTISGGKSIIENRLSPLITSLLNLFDFSNMQQLDAVINTNRQAMSIILNTADKNGAYSYECSLIDTKKRASDQNGLLVATNHFIEPSWNIVESEGDCNSVTRRKNLLHLAEKNKGSFTPEVMMQILDTPIKRGGATEPEFTIQQIVAVPQELKIWLKSLGYPIWVEIDLKRFFRG